MPSARTTRRWLLALFLGVLAACELGNLAAAEAEDAPVGRVELVMDLKGFSGPVTGLSFSSDGTMLAASGQQAVRIWDLRTGRLLRVVRGEIGEDGYGDVLSVAFSRDNCELVVGIRDKNGLGALRTYDIRNMTEMKDLIVSLPGAVERLAFSRDGRHLVAVCAGGSIVAYDWRLRRVVGTREPQPGTTLGSLQFPVAEPLVMNMDSKRPTVLSIPGLEPLTIDQRVPAPMVRWIENRGKMQAPFEGQFQTFDLRLEHDTWLSSGVGKADGASKHWVGLWVETATSPKIVYQKHHATITAIALNWLGSLAASAEKNGEVHVWETETGQSRHIFRGMGQPIYRAALDVHSGQIGFAARSAGKWDRDDYGKIDQVFDLPSRAIRNRTDGEFPAERTNRDGRLSLTYANGKFEFRSLSESADERFLTTSSTDRAIRVWSLKDSREHPDTVEPLLSLVIVDEDDWILWTPQGYYDASPGCGDLVGWHVNRGPDQVAAYYPLHQFRNQFYQPDLVNFVLQEGSVAGAIAQVTQLPPARPIDPESATARPIDPESATARPADTELASARPTDAAPAWAWPTVSPVPLTTDFRKPETMQKLQPPRVRLLSPRDGMTTQDGQVHLLAEVISANHLPITEVKVLVNGRPASGKGISVVGEEQTNRLEASFSRAVKLLPGENEITVLARNKIAAASPITVRVNYEAPREVINAKPNLHLLSIGISDYQDKSLSLRYAHQDATAFADAWQCQLGPVYGNIRKTLLLNEEATTDRIRETMRELVEKVAQRDIVVLFISAHGIRNRQLEYYLATHEIDPENLDDTSLHFSAVTELLQTLPCKVLMFIDTCHAAGITGAKAIPRDPLYELTSDEYGAIVFSSSLSREISREDEKWGHGAFTKAILDTFANPGSDLNADGFLSLTEMEQSVCDRVEEMTQGEQHPVMKRPATIHNIPFYYLGEDSGSETAPDGPTLAPEPA